MRQLVGYQKAGVDLIAIGFALFFIYAIAVTVPFYITTPLYICLCYVLVFCLYPARRGAVETRIPWWDLILAAIAIGVTAFFYNEYDWYVSKPGLMREKDVIAGVVMALLSLEVARRVLGFALPILAILAFLYALFGSEIPGQMGHRGYSLDRAMGQIFSFDGIYGSVTSVYSTFVLLFVIFGAVIQACGMGTFLLELSNTLVGRLKGGTAKTAVVSSATVGMIMGSGAANVAVTGSFTIPLMKRAGFPAHISGAIETVASSGGVLLPPIMGSAAFILASFTQTPYSDVALYSFLPALLFFWGIYAQVHMVSHRLDVPASDPGQPLREVLVRGGHMLIPIAIVFALIFSGTSAYRAGLWAIAVTFALHYLRPLDGKRMNPKEFLQTFGDGAKLQLSVGASAGVIGIIIAMLVLPGTPLKVASFAVGLAQGNPVVLMLLMIVVSYVFGMGIPMVAAYIILAVIAVPALIEVGIPLFNAHLIIMWFSLAALWTPPVAVGAFIASGIAGAPAGRIGWFAVRLGVGLYVIPFLMAFGTIINGTWPEIIFAAFSIAVGLYGFAAAAEGHSHRPLHSVERGLYAILAVAAMYPDVTYRIAGLFLFAMLVLYDYRGAVMSRVRRTPGGG